MPQERFCAVDILRIAAIAMVVAWHTGFGWGNTPVTSVLLNHVPLFVALSFFLCAEAVVSGSLRELSFFLARRSVRILRLLVFWLLLWWIIFPETTQYPARLLLTRLLTARGALYFLPLLLYLLFGYSVLRLLAALVSARKEIYYLFSCVALAAMLSAVLGGGLRPYVASLDQEAQLFIGRLIILSPYGLLGLVLRGYYPFIRGSVPAAGRARWFIPLAALGSAFALGLLNESSASGFLGARGAEYAGLLRLGSVFLVFYAFLSLEGMLKQREALCRRLALVASVTPGVYCAHTIVWQCLHQWFGLARDGTWLSVLTLLVSFCFALLVGRLGRVGRIVVT